MRIHPLYRLAALAMAIAAASTLHAVDRPASAPVAATAASADYAANPAETFNVGTLKVQRYGDHGTPVILIPGLGSGAWVWKDTVEALRKNHVVYTLTLAGFDDVPVPAGSGSLFDRADDSLAQLIRGHKIGKPVLVGHSLGGTLALRFAGEHADLISGVVAVEGLPLFPGMDGVPEAQRLAMARGMREKIEGGTPEAFKASQVAYMQKIGVIDPAAALRYGALNGRSDPKAVAEYMAEDLSADLRAGLKGANVPILEISPYNPADASAGPMAMTEAQKTAYYGSLLATAPNARVVPISPARHFAMLDQPEKFRQVLTDFIDRI
ncbi:MAG TPA: alpha/beta hydrolase [Luteibacter sp.]|jgi:pimeloyl-ACP methyl ester carboxylesterase|nr:alpha/beta hydrolase [Luteibacter sp.]